MTADASTLIGPVQMRVLQTSDAGPLSAAYQLNRDHLGPWEPARSAEFFTPAGQSAVIESKLALQAAGQEVPWVLLEGSRIIGTITLTGIVRGPFLSANLGYWVDKEFNSRGIGSAAVGRVLAAAKDHLGLHRVQAATLVHNAASRRILARAGFDEIGTAPSYLKIAGTWQDHVLFQRILG
ncbi:GNAT family N-acetyltransferase [Arthrobacter oryzae]|uniref:GNAT family N-acetyltransferase n=1 Tax=Arthrobacter oryzae TaxID=409290 RepID=UPI00273ABD3F|nr:GNAT family N-acetyltransferase [Arthrobacter oryzae]WLQ08500.1 GNAT family N-acetyltransferase [Arthrobacter oryzae]